MKPMYPGKNSGGYTFLSGHFTVCEGILKFDVQHCVPRQMPAYPLLQVPPTVEMLQNESRRVLKYRISGGFVSGSAALISSPLPLDSKALRSESDIFATRAKGSCGVDPGPVHLRIATLSVSSMGDWLYGVWKRIVFVMFLMFSIFAMQHFTALAVGGWGGGTDLAMICPKKGSPRAGVFKGIAPSSA